MESLAFIIDDVMVIVSPLLISSPEVVIIGAVVTIEISLCTAKSVPAWFSRVFASISTLKSRVKSALDSKVTKS